MFDGDWAVIASVISNNTHIEPVVVDVNSVDAESAVLTVFTEDDLLRNCVEQVESE